MSQTRSRVAGGLLAFLLVAAACVAGSLALGAADAAAAWTLAAVLAVPAGIAVYALIEFLQTGRLDSLARQLDTRVLVLMPLAMALNIALGTAVASALKLPIYLDSIGTILVAALGGPLAGALTGLFTNLAWSTLAPPPFGSPFAAPFAIVAVVIGLLAGTFARWGWLRPRRGTSPGRLLVGGGVAVALLLGMAALAVSGWSAFGEEVRLAAENDDRLLVALGWLALLVVAGTVVGLLVLLVRLRDLTAAYLVVAGVATGLVAACIGAPIAASLFGGVTGSGTDFLVAAFRQAGADIQAAALGQALISDPIDKVITYFVAYLILGALSVRTLARFPQGSYLIAPSRLEPPARPASPEPEVAR